MPRFSIIITCYNQASFIRDAVGSALAQQYPDKEVIVVDDCSTDGSRKALEEFGNAIKFKAFETNQGASAARNSGAALASGDFLVYLDGDDLMLPWALEVYARIVELKRPKLILAGMEWFWGAPRAVNPGDLQQEIAVVDYESYIKKDRAWQTGASGLIIDRRSFEEAGCWTHKFFPGEDHDLVLKLGCSGRTIQIISPLTTQYRQHATNSIHQVPKAVDAMMNLIRKEKAGQYPGGPAGRFERYAIIGGSAFYWLKNALKMKLYGRSLALMSAALPMILAAMFRRLSSVIRGRRPVEKLGKVSQFSRRADEGDPK